MLASFNRRLQTHRLQISGDILGAQRRYLRCAGKAGILGDASEKGNLAVVRRLRGDLPCSILREHEGAVF